MEQLTRPLWQLDSPVDPPRYPPLQGDISVDVAIVGAGITGLMAAWHLRRSGRQVAVLEAGRVGEGTTGSSTGNLYVPLGSRLAAVRDKHSPEVLRRVAAARVLGVELIERCVEELHLDCGFQRVPFHLFAEDEGAALEEVDKELDAARLAGLKAEPLQRGGFPFPAQGGLTLPGQAQFHPLRFARGLAAALHGELCRLYEDTPVRYCEDGEPCSLRTDQGKVTARRVIKATHSPVGVYAVHAAMLPEREFALAARLDGPLPPDGIYWLARGSHQYSVRPVHGNSGDYLLVLGQGHKPGHEKQEQLEELKAYLRARFPVRDFTHLWAAQNYQSADLLPYIGSSLMENNTFIATGFAADGLTWGAVAGMMLGDFCCKVENPWAETFDPKRWTLRASVKNLAKENVSVAAHLLKDHLFYGQVQELADIAPGEGKTLKVEGERVAAYRDPQGRLSVVSALCTHMGCVLHFNQGETSWDCPCHGSRFDVEGRVLEGPALLNLARPLQGEA